ncbi:MAG: hypothetical protein QUS35_11975 [bacterium]|nr:hypothetical protein [bacterium]
MAHLFMDDGQFESEDYSSNYIYFDGEDPECVRRMQNLAKRLAASAPEERSTVMDRARALRLNPRDAG